LDEALDDFDQGITDRDAEVTDPVTVELPGQLEYQQRDDEPSAPTYDLYQEGTIWGDKDWHEQGSWDSGNVPASGSHSNSGGNPWHEASPECLRRIRH